MSPASRRTWPVPVALVLLTASGLLSALVSELWADVWSWFALGLPVLVMAWCGLRRRTSSTQVGADGCPVHAP